MKSALIQIVYIGFILLLSVAIAISHPNIDSLKGLLDQEISDSVRIETLKELGAHYLSVDTVQFKKYVDELISLGEEKSIETAILEGYNQLGNWSTYGARYIEAIGYYRMAMNLTSDSINIARLYGGIGGAHYYMNRMDSAEHYMRLGFEIKQKTEPDDSVSLGVSLFNLATLAEFQNRYDRALTYYHQAELYFSGKATERRLAILYNNMGTAYKELDNELRYVDYFTKAYNLSKSIPHLRTVGTSATNLAAYYETSEPEKADELYKESISALREIGQQYSLARSLNSYSYFLANQGRTIDAQPVIKESIEIGQATRDTQILIDGYTLLLSSDGLNEQNSNQSYANELSKISDAYQRLEAKSAGYFALYTYYDSRKKSQEALNYYEKHISYRDSVDAGRFNQTVKDLELKYETKENELKIAEQENEIITRTNERNFYRMIGLIALPLFGLILLALWQYRKISNTKIDNLEKQQKLMALDYMVQGQEEERKRIAQDLHDGLGGLLASARLQMQKVQEEIDKLGQINLLTKAEGMIDHAHQEVRRISHDMMPGALIDLGLIAAIEDLIEPIHLSGQLNISQVDNTHNIHLSDVQKVQLYRSIQELINNVVKHASANQMNITFSTSGTNLEVKIEDDGIGFDVKKNHSDGLGINGVRNRIQYLNGHIEFTQLNQGTRVEISIPL